MAHMQIAQKPIINALRVPQTVAPKIHLFLPQPRGNTCRPTLYLGGSDVLLSLFKTLLNLSGKRRIRRRQLWAFTPFTQSRL
jgi:hypothetical protein